MNRDTFISQLTRGADSMGLRLDDKAIDRMFLYYSELERWNRKVSLVSRRSHDWVRIHFLDSLAASSLGLIEAGSRLIDLGSGAGFPGVPLKLAAEDLSLAAAEASGRKCAWLRHLLRSLEIRNAQVLEGRFEDLLEGGWGGRFDVAVSRAAARPRKIIDTAGPFLCSGGRVLIYTTEALVEKGTGKVHPYRVPGSKVPSVIWEVAY